MRHSNMLAALSAVDARWKSKLLQDSRVSAARSFSDGTLNIRRPPEGEVLDFFEALGLYLHRKIFDRDLLWEKYSYFIEPYWQIFSSHINQHRALGNDETWYDKFEYLNHQMEKCAREKGLKNYGKKTSDQLATFAAGELAR